jgi:pimeloyl-ACP methyl ester carboxylesterase
MKLEIQMLKRNLLPTIFLLMATVLPAQDTGGFPGKVDDWNGYQRHSFTYDSRQCFVVEPKTPAPGKPWIWRARFWGHRPEVDVALLGNGFHVAYMDVAEMLGNKEAVAHWDKFYELLTGRFGLSEKVAMEGMSRGGLYIYSWAAANPGKVSCMYADAPVCDIKSWPLALRKGAASPTGWKMVVAAFGFQSEEDARKYKGNPIDILAPLAKAKIPLLHVHGDADDVVPLEENTAIVEKRYKALGGDITVIIKPGIGHKHGLDDPSPIIGFVLKNTPAGGKSK